MKKFVSYFIQGLILFIPVLITLAILYKIFEFFSGIFLFFGITDNLLVNTLAGLIVTIGSITALGVLASSYIFSNFFGFLEDKLEHAPLIRHIYSPIKDFTNAFMGNKKRFNKPVLVTTNVEAKIQEIGFLTNEDLSHLQLKDKVAVYMPYAYSLSGKLIIVPANLISKMNTDAAETMKFVVSGGVTTSD